MQQTRKQLIQRFIVYTLMSLSVVVIVVLLMLAVLGYSFKDNNLEQGGLLKFGSVPVNATVTLDQVQLNSRTPSQVTADARSHAVTISRNGYHSWHKTIDLKAGMVGWLTYARLVPTDPKVEKIRATPLLASMVTSPDRKWIVMVEDETKPAVVIANIQNDEVAYDPLALPATSFTPPAEGKPSSFKVDSWSPNSRYILLRHIYDVGKMEWILVDREDETRTKNISARLGFTSDKVIFAANDGRTALAVTEDAVRRLNLSDETISRPLVANVQEFSVFNEHTILYTTKVDPVTKLRTVGYLADGMEAPQLLKDFPDDGQPIHIAMADYFGKRHVAVSHGASVEVLSGELPRLTNKGTLKTVTAYAAPSAINKLSFSGNRMIVAETGSHFTVRDLELDKTDSTAIKDLTNPARPLRWIDSYITWYDAGGVLRLYEFDGANQQNVMPVAEGFDVAVSPNQKFLYAIGHDAAGFHLQRVRMVLE